MHLRLIILTVLLLQLLQPPVVAATTFQFRFIDVPEQARRDVELAGRLWSHCIRSELPIRVRVQWLERGPTGFALPRPVRNAPHLPVRDAWYPAALADALAARRSSSEDDINIFLSGATNWSFTDKSTVAPGEKDFVNVVLHELAHGLGMSSASFIPWEGEAIGSIGLPNAAINWFDFSFALPELDGTPALFDTFVRTGDGRAITDVAAYPNPSPRLAEALRDPGIHFAGERARAASGGRYPLLEPGNIAHFPLTDPTPLMYGDSGSGERRWTIDRVLLGVLADLGWQVTPLQCDAAARRLERAS